MDVDLDSLNESQQDTLYTQMDAWRFEDKFPQDKLAQLKWAILEEKRRIVRLLISRVIVGKSENPKRTINPILALDLSLDSDSLDYGDQSLAYIEGQDFHVSADEVVMK